VGQAGKNRVILLKYGLIEGFMEEHERHDLRERSAVDLVQLYLSDIGRYPLITKEDEFELWKRMDGGQSAETKLEADDKHVQAIAKLGEVGVHYSGKYRTELQQTVEGGQDAKSSMIKSNLRLVVSIAKRYQASGMPLLDLVQEGNLGLEHAVEKFDASKGFKFSTYATWWIRQAVGRGIGHDVRTVRLPSQIEEGINSIRTATNDLENEGHHDPDIEALSDRTGMTPEKVRQLQEADRNFTLSSLDQPLLGSEAEESTLGSVLADRTIMSPGDQIEQYSDRTQLAQIIEGSLETGFVTEKGVRILALRWGLDGNGKRTYREIAEEYGVTPEAIRRRLKVTERKLREYVEFYNIENDRVA
jgi:RNA polymerase sigma factor (sigma-70 family)